MKRIISLCLTAILLAMALPVFVQAARAPVLWTFDEENAERNWSCYDKSVDNWADYFSFCVKNDGENNFGSFTYNKPDQDMVIRYKRSFGTAFQLPDNGYAVLSCRVKLSGDNIGTYQLRMRSEDYSQEILMGFGEKVSIYKNHNPISLQTPAYCDAGLWHDVEMIFSAKDKAMLHYFDGKPISGEWVPLYTYSDGTQFSGPYSDFMIVSYAEPEQTAGSQEFMIDDIAFYELGESTLLTSSPAEGSSAVNPLQPITLTFNQYIDEVTLAQAQVTVNGETAAVSLDATDGKTCLVTPSSPLLPGKAYTVSVEGIKDILGADLSACVNFKTRDGVYVKDIQVMQTDSEGAVSDITNTSMLGGKITAKVLLGNENGAQDSVAAAFALYDDGGNLERICMTDVQSVNSDDMEKEITLDFTLSEQEAQRYQLKLFALGMSDLTPLMNVWQSQRAYFVSPDGSDSNMGSLDAPFKTLARAVRATQAGDTVIFEDGEYEETEIVTFKNGGAENAPIILRARNKGEAKITFKSSANENLKKREKINIPKNSGGYVTIKDLVLTQDAPATVNDNTTVDIFINCRASNCSFIGNEIYNCFEEPIKAAGVSNILVADNILHDSVHEGIDFVNVSDSTVRGNTISEIERIAVMVKGGSRNIKVYNNTVYNVTKDMDEALSIGGSTDNYSGLGHGKEDFEGYNQYFWNNVIYVSGTGSIDTGILFQGSKDSVAFNNTVSGCNYGIKLTNAPGLANDWEWDPINKNAKIYNNLIVNAKKHGIYESYKAENLVSDYNWFSKCAAASEVDGNNSFTIENPGFVDAAAGDFRIKADSLLAGEGFVLQSSVAGYNGTIMQLDLKDKNGVSRGSKWAIGAYQPMQ